MFLFELSLDYHILCLLTRTIKDGIIFLSLSPHSTLRPFLLAADIDGTLLGDEQGAAWLKALLLAYPGSFYLALVTGRSLPSILTLIEEGRLPQPDFICCDVGTELLVCADPENVLGKKYTAQVSPGLGPRKDLCPGGRGWRLAAGFPRRAAALSGGLLLGWAGAHPGSFLRPARWLSRCLYPAQLPDLYRRASLTPGKRQGGAVPSEGAGLGPSPGGRGWRCRQ